MWSSVSFAGVESSRQVLAGIAIAREDALARQRSGAPRNSAIFEKTNYGRDRGEWRRPVRIVMAEVSSTVAIPFITEVKARFAGMMLMAS